MAFLLMHGSTTQNIPLEMNYERPYICSVSRPSAKYFFGKLFEGKFIFFRRSENDRYVRYFLGYTGYPWCQVTIIAFKHIYSFSILSQSQIQINKNKNITQTHIQI